MKIVLFNPRGFILDPHKRSIRSLACIMPPIGILSIAAVLRDAGHQVEVFDGALFESVTNVQWAERICADKPDMVGFTATTSAFYDAYDVCKQIKERAPETMTVFGGVHVSWGKELILRDFPAIDIVVAGEGEVAITSLAAGNKPQTIPGVWYRDGEKISSGTGEQTLLEMDSLPFPAYGLLKGFPKQYLMPLFGYPHHPGANIISSRGCVYQCSYCDRSVFGRSFRWNSPEYTFEQIKWLNRDFRIRHINFYDDLFTMNRARVESLCNKLIAFRPRITFNCIVRAGHIDKELISILKRAGCWLVSIGIESGDQSILDSHKEGLALEALRRDIAFLNNSGLWVKGLFMMGLPGETEESIIRTREFACSLPIKDANMTAFTPFPGAPITKTISDFGEFDNDWAKMDCINFVFVSKEIGSVEKLQKHYAEFYRSFYNRSFMRNRVYPSMLLQSPHSYWRFIKGLPSFLSFAKSLKRT